MIDNRYPVAARATPHATPPGYPAPISISLAPPPRRPSLRMIACSALAGALAVVVCGCAGLTGLALLLGHGLGISGPALPGAGGPRVGVSATASGVPRGPATPAPGDVVAAGAVVFTNSNAGGFADTVALRPAGFHCLEYVDQQDLVVLHLAPHGQPGDTATVDCHLDIPAASAGQFAHGLPPDALLGSCPAWGVCYDNPRAFVPAVVAAGSVGDRIRVVDVVSS